MSTMDFLLLLVIFAVFALPTLLLSRASRKRAAQAQEMQASVKPGDRIVTVSGFHGVVVAGDTETVDLEIAPGTVVTMERAGVLRVEQQLKPAATSMEAEAHRDAETFHGRDEIHPENLDRPEGQP